MLFFDLETDGLLDDVTQVHCLVIKDTAMRFAADVYNSQTPGAIEEGVRRLMEADCICGHNIIRYDLPVLAKLYPWFKPSGAIRDTILLSRLIQPETAFVDSKLIAQKLFPAQYRGLHKLEAWGYRLGILKGEYEGDPAIADVAERKRRKWERWNQSLQDYCVQDVVVTEALYKHLKVDTYGGQDAIEIEHAVAQITWRQERNGIHFDTSAARELYATLSKKRLAVTDSVSKTFGVIFVREGPPFTPKKDHKKLCYTEGAVVSKVKPVQFNPGSRHHIARVLKLRYGWMPESFTPTGEPEVNEQTLAPLKDHPDVALLLDYLLLDKRISQLAEGKQAWLKKERNGKLHGGINTLGTVTGRMSHSEPNLAQVPACHNPYGKECRALFKPRAGWKLVGIDAASLELRVLAHFMARYDGGAYGITAVEGVKSKGTDIHSVNMRALEIDSRDDAKTWFYAFIYGAGDGKLGSIITKHQLEGPNRRVGKTKRALFMRNLPAMGKLVDAIKAKAKKKKGADFGYLRGLDGRVLWCRSDHASPNTLFQSAGAVVMKKALVLLDESLQLVGHQPGVDYEFVANVHDEWQIECRPEIAQEVGKLAVEAIRAAGGHFGFRCPLDGDFSVGTTWAETH
jgi:DNA polymerase I-like protein with 3'-5' exonuclease and polymerase domains